METTDSSATKPETLSDSAYRTLKAQIVADELAAGFQIPEPELAARLGMSRTPLREALVRLEAEGFVELVPRRGVRILAVSADDMREIYDILTALEPHAARRLAEQNPAPARLKPMTSAVRDMEAAIAAGDLKAWAVADACFHDALLEAVGNTRLKTYVTQLHERTHRARMITLRLRKDTAASTTEHRNVLDAISRADGDAAAALMRQHRERAAAELTEILAALQLSHL